MAGLAQALVLSDPFLLGFMASMLITAPIVHFAYVQGRYHEAQHQRGLSK